MQRLLDVTADHPDDDERPKSPWTPSYSVTVTGSAFNEPTQETELTSTENGGATETSKGSPSAIEIRQDTSMLVIRGEPIQDVSEPTDTSFSTVAHTRALHDTDEGSGVIPDANTASVVRSAFSAW